MNQTAAATAEKGDLRHDWNLEEIEQLFALPFNDLLFQAQQIHRQHFEPNTVQVSTLINIKTGGCAEDCGYCSQSAHFDTGLAREALMAVDEVVSAAKTAQEGGATRFCMGAAWRKPRTNDMDLVIAMIKGVKGLGMEACVTLGMLEPEQVQQLKEAGLDYYNHNIDTSPEYYDKVVTTRKFADRIDTITRVREAGINVCSGGILGMGEERRDRAAMLQELANLPEHPGSVPINLLVKVPGTPLGDTPDLDIFEFIRTIAVARLMMPASYVRLSAGRETMHDEAQALCFLAGANSLFYGDKLLTTENATTDHDKALFQRLGIQAEG
ncbi:MAG: biotin synthase BioB [Gammaproteobacteria bacterium]|nr:biotin synthase BioB [Gammaproteobacteria bacterium]MCW8993125.1 biotin synthase BioB [Gammaproteobacteria bacterium]